ncbi:possible dehydrogenase [Blautia sp. CAG:52]|jgi:predicted dehydrogenase|nr:possible dehydrogenase [Blautia sp. CAG:52]
MMDNYEVESVTGQTFHKLADQTNQGNAFGDWDPKEFCVEDSAFGFIRMKNGAVIELEAAWALNTLEVDEAKTSLCGTKAGADMKDGLRINYIHHNKQVVEKPALSGEGVAFFSGEEKPAGDYEQELFYHIVADGAEQIVKPAQAAVVTRVLEAIYESAKSGKTIYFD